MQRESNLTSLDTDDGIQRTIDFYDQHRQRALDAADSDSPLHDDPKQWPTHKLRETIASIAARPATGAGALRLAYLRKTLNDHLKMCHTVMFTSEANQMAMQQMAEDAIAETRRILEIESAAAAALDPPKLPVNGHADLLPYLFMQTRPEPVTGPADAYQIYRFRSGGWWLDQRVFTTLHSAKCRANKGDDDERPVVVAALYDPIDWMAGVPGVMRENDPARRRPNPQEKGLVYAFSWQQDDEPPAFDDRFHPGWQPVPLNMGKSRVSERLDWAMRSALAEVAELDQAAYVMWVRK